MKAICKAALFLLVAAAGARTTTAQSLLIGVISSMDCVNSINYDCSADGVDVMGYAGTFEIDAYSSCYVYMDDEFWYESDPYASAGVYEGCGNGTVSLDANAWPEGEQDYDEYGDYIDSDTIMASAYYQNPSPGITASSYQLIDCLGNTLSSYYSPPISCP